MSEVDTRAPTRGRSSNRGGRGGFGRGGPRGGRKANGTAHESAAIEEPAEDQGELGELKKKYATDLSSLAEIFPGWTSTDLVLTLQENNGDLASTVDKITQGQVSQFAEVKKSKDRARSKAKDETAPAGTTEKGSVPPRGGRGRGGFDGARGGRGRGSERGRGSHGRGRGGHASTNGAAKDNTTASVPTTESTAWDSTVPVETSNGGWDNSVSDSNKEVVDASSTWAANTDTAVAVPEPVKSSLVQKGGPSWANIIKTKPAPVAVPMKPIAKTQEAAPEAAPLPPVEVVEPEPEPEVATPMESDALIDGNHPESLSAHDADEPQLTPSEDPLTVENLEHLPDESHPPATQTVASTTGSNDPRNLTPLPGQQAPIGRPPLGGFATTAHRLAGSSGRSASFQRRVQEQQEAVVMPGHSAVDLAAVQFGSMGLNGEPEGDVDDDREDPETRQPPQHSPPSLPRTSLPPVPKQNTVLQESSAHEGLPTPKQAPGLPPASIQNQQQIQESSHGQSLPQDPQLTHAYGQYGRYGQPAGVQQEANAQQQKPYDPFGHQTQQVQYDPYGGHGQPPSQQSLQSGFGGGISSAQNDFSSYYTSDQQSRASYSQYYANAYGPQDGRGQIGQNHHDPAIGQQRSASGFGASQTDPTFAAQHQQATQSRFGEAPGSGNNTPNPHAPGQQPTAPNVPQSQQTVHQGQHQQQGGGYSGSGSGSSYPYGHPQYNSPYQQAYANQLNQYAYQPSGYYGGYANKQNSVYGQPHNYAMNSQSAYDQSGSSPANANAFSHNQQQSSMRSSSGMGSSLGGGIDEYSRGSAPTSSHQQNSGFGGSSINDPFARSTSGFGHGGYTQQPQQQQSADDNLKAYSAADTKNGPSPALGQQPGRPGSAAQQGGLPPPPSQGQQSGGFGGYGGFPGQNSQSGQYGGLGGLGNHQQQQGSQQSAYGGGYGAFGQYANYGSNNSRGGWGQNYSGGH